MQLLLTRHKDFEGDIMIDRRILKGLHKQPSQPFDEQIMKAGCSLAENMEKIANDHMAELEAEANDDDEYEPSEPDGDNVE